VEPLDKEALTDIHSSNVDEKLCFDDWLSSGRSPAWFFLDSFDELKLMNVP